MPHMTTQHIGLAYFVVSFLYASILTSLLLKHTRTRMLHRVATTAARLAHTGRVPVVHDNPEAQQWQAAQKHNQVAWKANKAAGITRVHYGVYDTTKK